MRRKCCVHTKVVSESKIAREMLCFTIETAVRLCKGRRCKTAVADMVAYARISSDRSAIGKCKRRSLYALEWWVAGGAGFGMAAPCYWGRMAGFHGGAVLLGNVIGSGQTHWNGGCLNADFRHWGALSELILQQLQQGLDLTRLQTARSQEPLLQLLQMERRKEAPD